MSSYEQQSTATGFVHSYVQQRQYHPGGFHQGIARTTQLPSQQVPHQVTYMNQQANHQMLDINVNPNMDPTSIIQMNMNNNNNNNNNNNMNGQLHPISNSDDDTEGLNGYSDAQTDELLEKIMQQVTDEHIITGFQKFEQLEEPLGAGHNGFSLNNGHDEPVTLENLLEDDPLLSFTTTLDRQRSNDTIVEVSSPINPPSETSPISNITNSANAPGVMIPNNNNSFAEDSLSLHQQMQRLPQPQNTLPTPANSAIVGNHSSPNLAHNYTAVPQQQPQVQQFNQQEKLHHQGGHSHFSPPKELHNAIQSSHPQQQRQPAVLSLEATQQQQQFQANTQMRLQQAALQQQQQNQLLQAQQQAQHAHQQALHAQQQVQQSQAQAKLRIAQAHAQAQQMAQQRVGTAEAQYAQQTQTTNQGQGPIVQHFQQHPSHPQMYAYQPQLQPQLQLNNQSSTLNPQNGYHQVSPQVQMMPTSHTQQMHQQQHTFPVIHQHQQQQGQSQQPTSHKYQQNMPQIQLISPQSSQRLGGGESQVSPLAQNNSVAQQVIDSTPSKPMIGRPQITPTQMNQSPLTPPSGAKPPMMRSSSTTKITRPKKSSLSSGSSSKVPTSASLKKSKSFVAAPAITKPLKQQPLYQTLDFSKSNNLGGSSSKTTPFRSKSNLRLNSVVKNYEFVFEPGDGKVSTPRRPSLSATPTSTKFPFAKPPPIDGFYSSKSSPTNSEASGQSPLTFTGGLGITQPSPVPSSMQRFSPNENGVAAPSPTMETFVVRKHRGFSNASTTSQDRATSGNSRGSASGGSSGHGSQIHFDGVLPSPAAVTPQMKDMQSGMNEFKVLKSMK